MTSALYSDGINDYVTVDIPRGHYTGSVYESTLEVECASDGTSDMWIVGLSSSSNAIELRPSIDTFRVRLNNKEFTFDLSGQGLTYTDLNVFKLRGWFDGSSRHLVLHVNDILVEQKDRVSDGRASSDWQ